MSICGLSYRRSATAAVVRLAAAMLVCAAGLAAAEDNLAPTNQASTSQAPVSQGAASQAPKSPAPIGGSATVPAPDRAAPANGTSLPPQPPPVGEQRGFFKDFQRWWEQSITDFNAKMKDAKEKFDEISRKQNQAAKDAATATQDAMKNAAQATKDAATAIVRLPNTRVIETHETCTVAGNGAPDCQTAAAKACRGKGFDTGQPVDVRTADKCPASLWISGQAAAPCPVETVVLRAVCQ